MTAFVEERFEVGTIAEYLDQTAPKREQFIEIHNAAFFSLLKMKRKGVSPQEHT